MIPRVPRFWSLTAGLAGVGVGCLFLFIWLGQRLASEEPAFKWSAYLLGDQGMIGATIGIVTLAGGVITVYMLFVGADEQRRQREIAEQAALFSMFKEGALLLASPRQSSALNGLVALTGLVGRHPDRFLYPVARAIGSHLADLTHDEWARQAAVIGHPELPRPPRQSSPMSVVDAVSVLGSLRQPPGCAWPAQLGKTEGMLRFQHQYLADVEFAHVDFSYWEITDLISWRLNFRDCSFERAELDVHCDDGISFRHCNMKGAKITMRNLNHVPIFAARFEEGCDLDGETLVNGIVVAAN